MDITKGIRTRRSVKRFLNQPIEKDKLLRVLDAGVWAPSAGNSQNWRFVIVRNPALKLSLAEACLNQYWMTTAPLYVVVCVDTVKVKKLYPVRGELYNFLNAGACVENILLQAHAEGLASCWVSAFDDLAVKNILRLPDQVLPIAVLPLGFPGERVPPPKRVGLNNQVFFERYGNKMDRSPDTPNKKW